MERLVKGGAGSTNSFLVFLDSFRQEGIGTCSMGFLLQYLWDEEAGKKEEEEEEEVSETKKSHTGWSLGSLSPCPNSHLGVHSCNRARPVLHKISMPYAHSHGKSQT